jgi:ATP-binding cassette subfamily B protein
VIYSYNEFKGLWLGEQQEGIALMLKPTEVFFELKDDKPSVQGLFELIKSIRGFRKLIVQLIIGFAIGTIIQVAIPFLSQALIDKGIKFKNFNLIYLILIAQFTLIVGKASIDFIRSWIILHISTKINIDILTDFLTKILRLPISFFQTKTSGDILQRVNDQKRIEEFLTGTSLNTIFAILNLAVFSVILIHYKLLIFCVFFISSVLYSLWVLYFLEKRKIIDHIRFDLESKNQSGLIQLIDGVQEIKLNNCEDDKRWEWEKIQANIFHNNMNNLSLSQKYQFGSLLINEGKNILITLLAALAVMQNEMSLGEMVAVQYVIGQLNAPLEQIITVSKLYQDAAISMERLNEVKDVPDEDPEYNNFSRDMLPYNKTISFTDVTFKYPGVTGGNTLNKIDITIPEGKTTAIVGMSGSGKTTLLKLLLRLYKVNEGSVMVGEMRLEEISHKLWRANCGAVMQDGFIFSDTIERNIVLKGKTNSDRLKRALEIANLQEFVNNLPLGVGTKIGVEGNGISQGQRQRILIARAVYKDPEYIFFDEATNALDSTNEKIIMNNLRYFFKNKTVVIVAHRLSTVRDADNIIVMENGVIGEQGCHDDLLKINGKYHQLIKNQLNIVEQT